MQKDGFHCFHSHFGSIGRGRGRYCKSAAPLRRHTVYVDWYHERLAIFCRRRTVAYACCANISGSVYTAGTRHHRSSSQSDGDSRMDEALEADAANPENPKRYSALIAMRLLTGFFLYFSSIHCSILAAAI